MFAFTVIIIIMLSLPQVNALLDSNVDISFCPEISSTRNLTNMVHFAMASQQLVQHMDEDTRVAASKVENMFIKSAGNVEPNLQTKNRKSLFMNFLE